MKLLSYETSFLFLCHTDARTHASNIIHNTEHRERARERESNLVFMPGVPLRLYQSEERERERERVQTSDGLLHFGHRPIHKPQDT